MAESKVGIGKASGLQHSSVPTLMADWSQLPKDILQPIYQKLDSDFYQLRFRSVCSSWRSSSIPKNHLLNFPSKCPLPLQCKQNIIGTSTYPLSKRTIFLINPPPNQQQTLTPWLIKIGPDDQGRTRLWNPLSRYNELPLHFPQHIDFNHLSVFQLGHEYVICNFVSNSNMPMDNLVYIKKVVALHNGNGNNRCSFLLAIHMSGKLAVFSSDEQWMMMPEKPPKPYTDVCVFNGRSIAEISVFCLDKQQILPLSDLPCSNLFWPPPQWTGLF